MEVICPGCAAKYAVPDHRIRGRQVRIACRKCSHAIVVDGTALRAANAGARVAEPPRPTGAALRKPAVDTGPPSATRRLVPKSGVRAAPGQWLVDLGGDEPEPMSPGEIAELHLRGAVTNWTRVARAEKPDEARELAQFPDLVEALSERGVVFREIDEIPKSRPQNEPPLAPGAKAAPVDLSAATVTVKANELWAAAGVAPLGRAPPKRRADDRPATHAATPVPFEPAIHPPRMLHPPPVDPDDDLTELYRKNDASATDENVDVPSVSEQHRVDELLGDGSAGPKAPDAPQATGLPIGPAAPSAQPTKLSAGVWWIGGALLAVLVFVLAYWLFRGS